MGIKLTVSSEDFGYLVWENPEPQTRKKGDGDGEKSRESLPFSVNFHFSVQINCRPNRFIICRYVGWSGL